MAEKKLTREEANELYDDLSKAMSQMMMKRGAANAQEKVTPTKVTISPKATKPQASAAYNKAAPTSHAPSTSASRVSFPRFKVQSGQTSAILFVALFCCAKIVVSALEAVGVGSVEPAQATIASQPSGPQWNKEDVKVLTSLDHRRAELEERARRLEQRELEYGARDRDLAVRLTELREITGKLKIEREKGEKQRNAQLDQLANVYGSMNPPEAAHLLEQLDINIAHSLIQRMPEKRIGQILSLMNAERALELTNRLSMRPTK
jgi:flagellar motility protein MotE (MotC chaperone)